jgi:protein-S-isoprenylcysteine O-methyltransferase Ste14
MTLKPYQRIFGAGPRGAFISAIAFGLAYVLGGGTDLPPIHDSTTIGIVSLALASAATAAIVAWSLRSLPTGARGRELVTTGAFHYVRHPLYAAFLGPFGFGLALFMDGWIYLAWVVLQYPIWHWNIAAEERLMHQEFGDAYADYCRKTGRFLPRLTAFRLS